MIDLKTARKIANNFFLDNGYLGVYEVRETDDYWLFAGKCKKVTYGTTEICVPKNGDAPYLFGTAHEDEEMLWNNAKVVSE